MFYLISIACLVWVLGVLYLSAKRLKQYREFHAHFWLFCIFYVLVHYLLPVIQYADQYYRYQPDYAFTSHVEVMLFATIFITLTAFCYSSLSSSMVPKAVLFQADINRKYAFFSLVIFLVAGFLASRSVLGNIQGIGVEEYLSDRLANRSFGGTVLLSHWVYAVCVISQYLWYTTGRRSPGLRLIFFLLFLGSFFYCCFYYFQVGNRNSIFLLMLSVAFIWVIRRKYQGRAFPYFRVGIAVLAFSLAFSVLGHLRSNQYKTDRLVNFFDDTRTSLVKGLNGAFGNNENLLWLEEHPKPLLLGSTYAAALVNVVPRSLWADKPVGAGPILRNYIFPYSYVVGGTGNTSYTTGLLNELQMNFGLWASLVFAPLLGFIMSVGTRRMFLTRNGFTYTCWMMTLLLAFVLLVYGEFLGVFSRLLFTAFPFVFMALIFRPRTRAASSRAP